MDRGRIPDEDDEPDEAVKEAQLNAQIAIQGALERMETDSLSRVAATQMKALERVLRHAAESTSFYRERLAPLLTNDQFNPDAWPTIPLLTRDEMRNNEQGILSNWLPDGTKVSKVQTSGSSGSPLDLSWNRIATISTRATVERMYAWHGLDTEAPLAEIRSFPEAEAEIPGRRMRKGWSFRGPNASYYRLSVSTPIKQQLNWLRMTEARYLMTYPTVVRELATEAMKTHANLSFDAILTIGEVLTPDIRSICREAFGARIIDSYGCQEIGKIAVQCDVEEQYHVCISNVLLEILDDNNKQVPPGGTGKVVLTSLYNYAAPLIRYEIGDYVRLGANRCSCGRALPVLTEIHGRRRNMITLPNGDRLWLAGRTLSALAGFVPSKKSRLVQIRPDRFELLYVADGSASEPDRDGLSITAAELIYPGVTIEPIEVTDLPRSEGGKYEDVVGLGYS